MEIAESVDMALLLLVEFSESSQAAGSTRLMVVTGGALLLLLLPFFICQHEGRARVAASHDRRGTPPLVVGLFLSYLF